MGWVKTKWAGQSGNIWRDRWDKGKSAQNRGGSVSIQCIVVQRISHFVEPVIVTSAVERSHVDVGLSGARPGITCMCLCRQLTPA